MHKKLVKLNPVNRKTYVKCVEEQRLSTSRRWNNEIALDALFAKVLITEVSVSRLNLVFTVKMLQRCLSDVNPAENRKHSNDFIA